MYYQLKLVICESKILLDNSSILCSTVQWSRLTEIQQSHYMQFCDLLDHTRAGHDLALN